LQDLSVNAAGSINVVGWSGSTVLGGAVNLGETSNTDSFAEVDVTGVGGSTNVVPVDGLRRELVGCGGLDGVNPTCKNEALVFIALYRGMDPRMCEFTALKDLMAFSIGTYLELGAFPVSSRKQHMPQ
jgi:hypothetical protein